MINLEMSKHLKTQYANGIPYPHIVFDNFVVQEGLLDKVIEEFNTYDGWGCDCVSGDHQVAKYFSPWNEESLKNLPPTINNLLQYFNSDVFIKFLEELTGIENLLADPTFSGGGMHKIFRGGKLSVHADFSLHPELRHLHRRLNLLLYLNKNWQSEWGGSLRLYDVTTKKMVHDILPLFNRAVIFSTTVDALHGHPHPLNCPDDVARHSLALYYFTEEKPDVGSGTNLSATWYDIKD